MKQAANALNWGVGEMERRYKLMSKLGVRNLSGYNKKIDDAAEQGESLPNPFSLTPGTRPSRLGRLAFRCDRHRRARRLDDGGRQEDRGVDCTSGAKGAEPRGIHLILATQRPSVDVITGLIKANIPTRLSFQVSSKIDSRTILDQMGAEALLGMGDMLYMPSGTGFPVRVHGAFVSDDEVHRVVSYLKSQGEPNYIDGILEGGTLDGDSGDADVSGSAGASGESDAMYDQAVAIVLQHRRASISLVQRHLRIGYNRAAQIAGTNGEIRASYRPCPPTAIETSSSRPERRMIKLAVRTHAFAAFAMVAQADSVDTLKAFVRDVKSGAGGIQADRHIA
jgi:DNA segregation ATPase FtsK/SpoIIIE, S-DNA-T family